MDEGDFGDPVKIIPGKGDSDPPEGDPDVEIDSSPEYKKKEK